MCVGIGDGHTIGDAKGIGIVQCFSHGYLHFVHRDQLPGRNGRNHRHPHPHRIGDADTYADNAAAVVVPAAND